MNSLFSFLLLVIVAVVFAEKEMYTTKYDGVNLDDILKSERLTKNYVECCLDKATCTTDGEELKRHIKDALETGCDKCSDKQKKAVKKVVRKLHKDKPEWWKALCDHFDPERKYWSKYQHLLEGKDE